MKKLIIRLLISILLFQISNGCMQKDNMEQINSIILSVKEKYAPDKRVAIFNISPVLEDNSIKLLGETNQREGLAELLVELKKLDQKIESNINILPDSNLGQKNMEL